VILKLITTNISFGLEATLKPIIKKIIEKNKHTLLEEVNSSTAELSLNYKDNLVVLIYEIYKNFSEDEIDNIKKYNRVEVKAKEEKFNKLLLALTSIIEIQESNILGFGTGYMSGEKSTIDKIDDILSYPLQNIESTLNFLKDLKEYYGEIVVMDNWIRVKDGELYNYLKRYSELEKKRIVLDDLKTNLEKIEKMLNRKINQFFFIRNNNNLDFEEYIKEVQKYLR